MTAALFLSFYRPQYWLSDKQSAFPAGEIRHGSANVLLAGA